MERQAEELGFYLAERSHEGFRASSSETTCVTTYETRDFESLVAFYFLVPEEWAPSFFSA